MRRMNNDTKRNSLREWTVKYLMNPYYIKLLFMITTFGLTIPMLKATFDILVKVAVVWGGIYLLYDLFTKRWFLKTRYIIWLLIFLVLYFVSNLVNYDTYLYTNTVVFVYMVLMFLVVYPVPEDLELPAAYRQLRLYCTVFILLSFVASAVAVLVYFLNFNYEVVYSGKSYWIGVHEGRFWGIFNNPNLAAVMAVLSIMLSAVYFLLREAKSFLPKGFLIANIILHILIIMYTGSRGGELLLWGILAFTAFFWRDKIAKALFRKGTLTHAKSIAAFALVVIVGIGGYLALEKPARLVGSEVPRMTVYVRYWLGGSSEGLDYDELTEELDRPESPSGDVTTGRRLLWSYGFDKFLSNPVFGVTSEGLNKEIKIGSVLQPHLHSLYLQLMASTGILSLLVFLAFKMRIAVRTVCYLFTCKEHDLRYYLVGILGAFAATMMIYQTVEVFEVFQVILVAMVMWTLLGYMVYFLPKKTKRLVGKNDENRESD